MPVPNDIEAGKEYPLLFFMHGGGWSTGIIFGRVTLLIHRPSGFFAGSASMEDIRLRHLCISLRICIVNVEYRYELLLRRSCPTAYPNFWCNSLFRLPPEHEYPINLEDCYTALKWVCTFGRVKLECCYH